MQQNNVAYLINSTPKYYYLLELHIVLLKRYAPNCVWPIYFGTEVPNHAICKLLNEKYGVIILELNKEDSSFLSSRKASLELLPSYIQYVIPMQEDFLLERYIDEEMIEESFSILENNNIHCIRYMPCPGPSSMSRIYNSSWKYLEKDHDTYLFSFQASMWKKEECLSWYTSIVNEVSTHTFKNDSERNYYEVTINIAENQTGQQMYSKLFNSSTLGYVRKHKYSNAVYMSPWPYRPTAIIKGVLQPFAKELAEREGITLHYQN